jgi:hypothetical protein
MKSSTGPRKTAILSESVHHQLNMYAIAASAAGVGVLALAQNAEAKIIYTATHRVLEAHHHYNLDLNHDGKADFKLGYFYSRVTSGTIRSIYASGVPANGVEGTVGSPFLAAAFNRGTAIPNHHRFSQAKARMAYQCDGFIGMCAQTTSFKGGWVNAIDKYLGLKFKIQGKTHYGWARLTIRWEPYPIYKFAAVLTGYAYETIPNKSIIAGQTKGPDDAGVEESRNLSAPEPASLGALAMGAPGLSIWRRDESLAATSDRN